MSSERAKRKRGEIKMEEEEGKRKRDDSEKPVGARKGEERRWMG